MLELIEQYYLRPPRRKQLPIKPADLKKHFDYLITQYKMNLDEEKEEELLKKIEEKFHALYTIKNDDDKHRMTE